MADYVKGFLVAMGDGVCKVDMSEKILFAGQVVATGETWHKRLEHINCRYLNKMIDGFV